MSFQDHILVASDVDLEATTTVFASNFSPGDKVLKEQDLPIQVFSFTWPGGTFSGAVARDYYQTFVNEQFGFAPTVKIIVTRGKQISFDEYLSQLIKSVLRVIQHTNWDLALLRGDNHALLLRSSEGLLLQADDAEWTYWTPERLKMIEIPYKITSINDL